MYRFLWVVVIAWWQIPISLIAFIAGHTWFAIKHGWEKGNKPQI